MFDLSKTAALLANVAAAAVLLAIWSYHHFTFVAREWDIIVEHIAHHTHWHRQPPAGAA